MKIIFITLFLLFYLPPATSGIDESTKDLDNVKKQIKDIDKEIKKNKDKKKNIDNEIKQQEKKISKTRKEIHSINKKSKQNQKKLEQLNQDQKKLEQEIDKKKIYLSAFFLDIHKKGDSSYLKSIIDGDNPGDILRDQKLKSYFTSAQVELIDQLQTDKKKLLDTKKIINKTIAKIDRQKKDKNKIKKQLESEKSNKKQLLASVAKEIKNKEQAKKKLIDDEKKLKSIIDELVIKAAKEEEKEQLRKKETKKTKSTEKVVPFKGGSFAKLKGKLTLPLKGKIRYKFGTKRKDTGIKWKGIFIEGKEGQDVKSVGNGKVAYADWLRGFGNLIIIDHGQGYMSLYGYNESVLLNVNDEVKEGDIIATVGNTGGLGINGLYFELRKNSKPFNPLGWTKK